MVQRVKWMQILSSYAIVRGKYKKIEPENILTEASTGQVWLTGFGICLASHSPRQRVIAGTFPYMAPEQTGRMNRSIDSRSDLYAYDITLLRDVYRSAPTRSDPMEWVHCHIARQPIPPAERLKGIREPVSAIIMKLLAKNAEERYQTAAGVEADFRKCLCRMGVAWTDLTVPAGRPRPVGPPFDPGEALRTGTRD
jgi:serine/threonine protein kinase